MSTWSGLGVRVRVRVRGRGKVRVRVGDEHVEAQDHELLEEGHLRYIGLQAGRHRVAGRGPRAP